MCVGAFLDFSAGRVSRAPAAVRAMRLEWVYRMMLEPRRLAKRYLGGAIPFLAAVLMEKFRRRRTADGLPRDRVPSDER
jgi:alpha-1,3-mannosyltransferase